MGTEEVEQVRHDGGVSMSVWDRKRMLSSNVDGDEVVNHVQERDSTCMEVMCE